MGRCQWLRTHLGEGPRSGSVGFEGMRCAAGVVVIFVVWAVVMMGTTGAAFGQPAAGEGQASRAAGPDQDEVALMRRGFAALYAGDTREAKRAFESLLITSSDMSIRHVAWLTLGQMTGEAFAPRQSHYLAQQVLDMVVLVPDEASYLAAIEQWRGGRIWPVLIEDRWFAPMFIAAFEPARVVRWSSPREVDVSEAGLLARVERHNSTLPDTDRTPLPGLVVMDPGDASSWGGWALAQARVQPIHVWRNDHAIGHILDADQAMRRTTELYAVMERYRLADVRTWTGLTLAGDYPYRTRLPDKGNDLFALDDQLGRNARGMRFAVTGRLMGTPTASIYQAMASLFLQPRQALMFDAYTTMRNRPAFEAYHMDRAAVLLRERGLAVEHLRGEDISLEAFAKQTWPGHRHDMVWINSAGEATRWRLDWSRTRFGYTVHMPLGHPTAIHMVQSNSSAAPHSAGTLAGQAIAGGAFWYYGSVAEPYLHAFTPPTAMAQRMGPNVPLAFAARRLPTEPTYLTWKLMLVGDPLFALRGTVPDRLRPNVPAGARLVRWEPAAKPREGEVPEPALDTLIQRFTVALLVKPDEAPAMLDALLPHLAQVPEDVLDRVVLMMARGGRWDDIERLPDAVTTRSTLARAMVVRHWSDRLDRALAGGELDQARAHLERLLALQHVWMHLRDQLDRWWKAMGQAGRQTAATAWFEELLQSELPASHRQWIEGILKQ